MKFLHMLIAMMIMAFPAHAGLASVNQDGILTINGIVQSVNRTKGEFTLKNGDNKIDVSIDDIDEDTLDQLIESGIIQKESYVTVSGKMEDGVAGPVIHASTINIYNGNE